ncbi:MotA/TolQ/ExbB proton channel family protein [Romboutsia ilealis]|uniref:MotA/TolQ/ExbB proton channel family protein n=1 Tax=Romboutsia ilealis TaxID=1115758 RepID=UPI002573F1CB|nr:MotA/TolQ/ExbB proton channel family protein [Romboutsia ilealis]
MEKTNKSDNKSMFKIVYILCSVLIPLVIILVSGLIPKNITTWIFAIVTVLLYLVGISLASRVITINTEIKEVIKQNENIDQLLSDEERFQKIDAFIEEGKNNQYKNIYSSYYNYKKSLDTSGQVRRRLYATYSASNFFDEDSVIYKNLYYKTINYITQALTGVGIFGTFLGIIQGISGLDMGNAQAMKSGISNLLSGVRVSFSTSLYGILLSVILTFILKISIEVTMKKCDELCKILDEIVPKSNDKEGLKELEIELKKQTLSIEKLATDLAEEMGKKFDISMQENLAKLTEDLGVFVAKMETNFANSLSETNASTALALNSSLQPTMQKLEAVMTNIQTQQEQSSMKFVEESMQAMKEAINIGTNDEMDKLKSTMDVISAKNAEMVETFTSSMENMKMLTLHQENLIKNTTTSTESMNVTTENIKELQDNLGIVIQSLKDVSSNNNVSLTNIQDTIESMKDSMSKQLIINKSVEDMVDKAVNLTQAQDQYISKLDKMSRVLDYNMENTQKYISDVTNGISEYKNYFERIKASTIDVANTLDSKYKNIVNDLSIVNKNLSTTVESVDKNLINKVNNMTNQVQSLVKDLNEYQAKTAILTNKIERFAQVEESTQELWMNYKESFEKLNETINDGVENYNKHINNGVTDVLTQFDTNISSAVDSLRKVADTLADSAEEISDNLEVLNTTSATR